MTEKAEILALADAIERGAYLNPHERRTAVASLRTAAASAEPVAWRTRWKTGSERDREWEMWTYRTEHPAPNDQQIIEPLYAAALVRDTEHQEPTPPSELGDCGGGFL